MLRWWKRKPEEEEESTYCGYILMQSDWYKKQVEEGLIDHTGSAVTVYREQQLVQLEAQGYKNVRFECLSEPTKKIRSWSKVRDWFGRHLRL